MPGNLAAAAPTGIMPKFLCTAFKETYSYDVLKVQYRDGTIQMSQLATASRKSFQMEEKLTASALATLKSFWDAHYATPFYFYNLAEGSPVGSNYDATGNSIIGRYVVVFTSQTWTQQMGMARAAGPPLQLIEVA